MSSFDRLAASGPEGLARDLSLQELSSFGVTSSAPATVVAGAQPAMFALAVPGVPLFFLIVSAVAGIWVIGYAKLSQYVQSAGAQAAFIARGLGRTAGVGAQGVALVAYGAIYLCLYGLFGAVAAPLMADKVGIDGPWWAWSLAAAVGVGLLGRTRAKRAGQVLKWLLAGEILAVLAIDVAGFWHPLSGHRDFADIYPSTLLHVSLASAGGVLAFTVACLIGFEETPGLAEDARNGKGDVKWALLIAVGFCGVFYAASALSESVGAGPDQVAAMAADPTSGFPFNLVTNAYGPAGATLAVLVNVFLATSVFAALASFHTVVVRYLYAAGRDRVAPAVMGRINPRTSSPSAASHVVTVMAFVVIAAFAVTHTDPVKGLFTWGSYVVAVGVLALMVASSVAVVGYFNVHLVGMSRWVTVVAPIIGAVLMFGLWLTVLLGPQTMIGAPLFGPLHLVLLALPVAGLIAGLIRAWVMRRDPASGWSRVAAPTLAEVGVRFPLEQKVPEFAGKEFEL